MMENNNDILFRLQQTQTEILCHIDEVCRKHDVKYSLYAGTLLGAVRHKGFIPWDDDLDICMTRREYERFLNAWDKDEHGDYILQNKENTPDFSQSFTKIRKDHTAFVQQEEHINHHTGIFVDVFPIDRIPGGKLSRAVYKYNCMKYQLFTREYIPENAGKSIKLISKLLLSLVPKNRRARLRKRLLKRITKYNSNESLDMVGIETMSSLRHPFESDMLADYTELQFGERSFMCDAKWDKHLKCKYGDYMQLPPEEERVWKHHPILIDFEHNYEELNENS